MGRGGGRARTFGVRFFPVLRRQPTAPSVTERSERSGESLGVHVMLDPCETAEMAETAETAETSQKNSQKIARVRN
jgi:hypothetical protein